MRSSATRPGPLLRLTALAGAAATAAVVAAAALELGSTHWAVALVALPLAVAVAVAARVAYPRLQAPAGIALVLLLAAIASGGLVAASGEARWAAVLHVGLAGAALAGSLVTAAVSFRGAPLPLGPWRDYLTLTKPRIMTLLLLTGAAGMFVGAGGRPDASAFAAMLAGLALVGACATGQKTTSEIPPGAVDLNTGQRNPDNKTTVLVDNRRVSVLDYWARPNGTAAQVGDDVHPTRFIFTYSRGAGGEGLAARPYIKTARYGVQLARSIYTNADGTIPPGGLTVNGATSFFQVDPANGRIYFTDADEARTVNIAYTGVDQATGQAVAVPAADYRIGLVTERAEAPVAIEQAVNETQLWTSLDMYDPAPSTGQFIPKLIWMFWASTRGGTPDLFFQTIAPRFTPLARR